jgi:hypothetical protein
MSEALSSCLALIVDVSLKSALLAAIAAFGLWILRVRNSAVRHRVWTLVLFGMLALPLLVQLTPGINVPPAVVPSSSLQTGINPPARETSASVFATQANASLQPTKVHHNAIEEMNQQQPLPVTHPAPSAVVRTNFPAAENWHFALIALYVAGVAYFAGRLIVALNHARVLVRAAQLVALPSPYLPLVAATRILESPAVRVPITIGCWRPSILLPPDWSTWSRSLLESVLAHEQAHVARRDQWITLLAEWNRALYWFHPLTWFLRHRLSALAEACCDDAVISITGNRTQYARHLLEVAGRLANTRRRVQPAGVAMARIPQVEYRIDAILDAGRPLARRMSMRGVLAMFGIAVPLTLLVAALKADDQDAPLPVPVRDRERSLQSASYQSPPTAGPKRSESVQVESSARQIPAPGTAQPGNTTANPAASQLLGRVIMESDGQPVSKAEVRLVSWTNNNTNYNTRTATTNDRGEFVFDRVAAGNHRLAAFFGAFSSRNSRYKGLAVDLSHQEPVTLKLTKMPSINVHVVSKENAAPIADALVRLPWSDTTHDHRTDSDGRVLLRCLTPEVWHVEVKAKGFAEQEIPVNLAGTDVANVTIELEPGGVLYGRITDEAGVAVAGAGFSVFPADRRSGQIEYFRTDGQGNYRFDYLPANQGLEVNVSGPGFLDLQEQVTLAAGAERKVDLVLSRRPHGGTVSGSVSDAAGNPVAGATLTNHGRSSRDKRTATTDELGIFVLDDVYEGSIGHELIVKADGFAPQRVKFRPGTQESPAKLAITLQAGHTIRGRVLDEAGKAIRGVAVYFAEGNTGSGFDFGGKTTTDADGRFSFDSLPADCPFTFLADGYSEIETQKLPLDGDEEVVVTMQSEGIIKGRVIDATTDKPISPFNVQITFSPDRKPDEPGHHLSGPRATSPDGEQFATRDGTFVLKELIRGMPLQVSVTADGYDRHVKRRVVAISEADAKEVDFRLERIDPTSFFTIRGRIVDELQRTVQGAKLQFISANEIQTNRDPRQPRFVEYPFGWQMIKSGNAITAAGVKQILSTASSRNGEFVFEQVRPAAAMQIVYWGEGVSQGRLQGIEKMSAADRANITIQIVTPGAVRGTIDRAALPKITSIALSPNRLGLDLDFHHAFLSAHDTSYEIRSVPPGTYQLQVYGERIRTERSDGFRHEVVQRHDIEVRAGETLSFNLAAPQ